MSVADLPETMIAIDPQAPGEPEVLQPVERPVPRPAEGEVLIKVAAAGVNRPDVLQRKGGYPPPPGAPSILGLEVAGEVVAANGLAEEALIGQPVCALIAGGGYAEYAVAPAGSCLIVPEALTMVEAAAMPETLFTVWINLFERAFAAEGDAVLVHGGTSGIGTMAIALGQLFGLRMIVTAGSDEKCARARALGADVAINYKTQDFVAEVKAATEGKGVQAVIDMVGGDYLPRNLQCLADDGRHVSIAVQRGAVAEVPIFEIMRRRLTLTGSTLRPRSNEFKRMVADEIDRMVWPHVREGRLKPVIDTTFPLAQAAAAHARMEAGEHVGKIVLTVG
jgi:NADPH:quinone reductase